MLAASQISALPVVVLMALGVLVALAGHVTRLRSVVVLGLAMLFLATGAMVLTGFVAYHQDPGDPRPEATPGQAHF